MTKSTPSTMNSQLGATIKVNGRIAVRVHEQGEDPMDDVTSWRWADDIRRGPSSLDFDKGYTMTDNTPLDLTPGSDWTKDQLTVVREHLAVIRDLIDRFGKSEAAIGRVRALAFEIKDAAYEHRDQARGSYLAGARDAHSSISRHILEALDES